MMKIKRRVEKSLPQLIEWAKENGIKDTVFLTRVYSVGFDIHGFIYFNSINTIPLDTMFTVEIEEEITEDTEFESIVEVTTDGLLDAWRNTNISAWKDVHSKEFHAYIDGEFKCIWRNGKLVD